MKEIVAAQLTTKAMLLALIASLLLSACTEQAASTIAELPSMSETIEDVVEEAAEVGQANESEAPQSGDEVEESPPEQVTDGPEEPPEVEQPEPRATAIPEPWLVEEVVVCLGGEMPDLYLYGSQPERAAAVHHALYENLTATIGFETQAQGLEKVPSLADGDARRNLVRVSAGDTVVDAKGLIVTLREGAEVVDGSGETVLFEAEPIWMEQLEVDFTFQPLFWSDGAPLTTTDSVFSFNVAADPGSRIGKAKTNFTGSYEATDEHIVRWTGLPGYLDMNYVSNVWTPLPAHVLDRYTGAELAELDSSEREHVASGPYYLVEQPDDSSVVLERNPHYYRSDEGAPYFDRVTIRWGSEADFLDENSGCDVIAGDALGAHNQQALEASGALSGWEIISSPGNVTEQLAFGIVPVKDYAERRPDWFGDSRVRQAIARCIDREAMVDELTGGNGEIVNSLAQVNHPLTPEDLEMYGYAPDEANALLDAAGYLDHAGDGRRQDITSGAPMTVTLGTNSESGHRLRIVEIVQENLAACGIPVTLYDRTAGTWFGSGPQGPIFGRQFDLAELAWVEHLNPDCTPFMSDRIPGPESAGFAGWSAPNISGWANDVYDEACRTAVHALPGGSGYEESMREALQIFNENLPALPLFTTYKVVAVRPGIANVMPDASQPSALWNLAEWKRVE